MVNRRLFLLLGGLPVAFAAITLCLLLTRFEIWGVEVAMIPWGAVNSAMPVAWATWLSEGLSDEPESGGGLMVVAIQLSMMLGDTVGRSILDHFSIAVTFVFSIVLLVLAAIVIGNGKRLMPAVSGRGDGEPVTLGMPSKQHDVAMSRVV